MGAVFLEDMIEDVHFDKKCEPYLVPNEPYTRFGFALAALDINHDGYDDLVVSAPSYGLGGPSKLSDYYPKSYQGRVFIYFGSKDHGIKRGAKPDIIIKPRTDEDELFNLGLNLRASDCNRDGKLDLIIMSPFSQQGGD